MKRIILWVAVLLALALPLFSGGNLELHRINFNAYVFSEEVTPESFGYFGNWIDDDCYDRPKAEFKPDMIGSMQILQQKDVVLMQVEVQGENKELKKMIPGDIFEDKTIFSYGSCGRFRIYRGSGRKLTIKGMAMINNKTMIFIFCNQKLY